MVSRFVYSGSRRILIPNFGDLPMTRVALLQPRGFRGRPFDRTLAKHAPLHSNDRPAECKHRIKPATGKFPGRALIRGWTNSGSTRRPASSGSREQPLTRSPMQGPSRYAHLVELIWNRRVTKRECSGHPHEASGWLHLNCEVSQGSPALSADEHDSAARKS